jgi:hypothetical protein
VLAQEEARLLNHSFIGTEHILLGLILEGEGVGAKALESLGVTLEAARRKVEETVSMASSASGGSPPFTPRAKKVLELSLREALQLEHSYIGTEHILLGLVREGDGVGAQVLVSLGADLGRVRQEVMRFITPGVGSGSRAVGSLHAAALTHPVPATGPGWVPPAWDRPSEGTVHSVLALNELVLQNDLIVITVDHLEVYPNGFTISLIMRVNPRRVREVFEVLGPAGPNALPRVRVRFADGRETKSGPVQGSLLDLAKDEHGIPADPYMNMASTRAAIAGWRALAWVYPLPPDGPFEIFVSLESGDEGESSVVVDGSAVRAAADQAREIWT